MPKAHGRAAVQLVLQQRGEQVVRAERGVVPGQPGPAKGLVRLLLAIHAAAERPSLDVREGQLHGVVLRPAVLTGGGGSLW